MTEIVQMKSVEAILFGVVKIEWADGYVGLVDLRPVLADGELFDFLRRTPAHFFTVALGDQGHFVYWSGDDGDDIDFGSESLRRRAERQAEILRLAS